MTDQDHRSEAGVTVYSSASQLRRPRQFVRNFRRELRVARGVAWRLFLRDVRSQHRRSLLGYVWILLPPVVTALVWVLLDRTGVIVTDHGGVPYPVFVLIGTFLWQGFAEGLLVPFSKLDLAQGLLTKYKLPPEALVLLGALDVGFNQAVRVVLLAAVYLVADVPHHSTAVLVVPAAVGLVGAGLLVGSALAPFGALYGDIARAVQLATMALFFVTPVVYSVADAGPAVWLNPVTALLVPAREWMLAGTTDHALAFLLVLATTLVLLPATFALYRLATPHLVDRAAN